MKRRVFANLQGVLFGFCYTLLAAGPAMADDTEIFFGNTADSTATRPNVLFILDTSGSMGTEVGTTNKTRMQHMQEALDQILDTATGVNVGLMRFTDPGGPILFPVSNIDATLSQATPSTASKAVDSRIASSADDAEEQSGTVTLDSARLEAVYVGGDTGIVSTQLSIGEDDAEETLSNNSVSLNSGTININSNQINGFRFNNTGIPRGATILSANMSLTPMVDSVDPMTLRLYAELSKDATPFTGNSGDLSNRFKTSSYIDWVLPSWTKDTEYVSPDMSSVVQELVNQSGWLEDDLAVLQTYQTGTAERQVYSYDASSTLAAKLNVSYRMGTPGQQTIGLRFRDVAIPQGATITSAVIEFVSAQSSSTPFVNGLTIQGFDTDDAPAFSASAADITGRSGTAASVNWMPDAWSDGQVVQTTDIKTLVQAIVDRSGWCGNNAMGFRISGNDLVNRVAHSFDGNPEFAPVLRVTYDDSNISGSQGCMNQMLVYRVNASENDAEQRSTGQTRTGGSSLNIESGRYQGLRFTNVLINQGATIISASLDYTAQAADISSTTVSIKGQAADNAPAFLNVNANISGRTTTTASASWSTGDWVTNNTYTSPDLKNVIQEIVNRGGWLPGNALAIIQTASGGTRHAYTFDNQPADAPLLKIKVQSGGVYTPVQKTVRTRLKEIVNELVPSGYTPIVDTLYEATNYYKGGPVLYGKTRGAQLIYGRVSHPDSYTGGTVVRDSRCTDDNLNSSYCKTEQITGSPIYTSPITDSCQTSHIVLLTDGQANHNNSIDLIKTLTGKSSCTPGTGGEACGRELAEWLATKDLNGSLSGNQSVKLFTVGFNLDEGGQASAVQFLKDLAAKGGGNYYSASTSSQLANVFHNIIRSIMNTNTSFVSPGATVNQFNRLTHENDIYFSVFKPEQTPMWPGNLKRYEIKGNPATIVDANNSPAVDPTTGFFADGSQSFWSGVVDGNDVTLGGAAEQLTLGKKVYTYTGTNNDLTNINNKLHESNANITKTMLGIAAETDAYRTDLLKWSRGVDVNDWDQDNNTSEAREQVGAPLHSQAVIITYGGTATAPINVVFYATNDGFLHAVDTNTGKEKFSFVPQELLPNLNTFYTDAMGTNMPYGLDGAITYWVKDVNGDHTIDPSSGDHVYLYVGMRRGGRNLYALDVSDPDKPAIKWTVKAGDTGFEELGQTWSSTIHTRVNIDGTVKEVLIFAGGYDPDEDDKAVRSADSQGRAVYIVDANDGTLLWSGGPETGANGAATKTFANMNYSIPSDIRIIDINNDGLADQMYVADMGGQLWRFDIFNGSSSVSLVDGGVIADLALNASGQNDISNNRRFYYAPDISIMQKDGQKYLSIAIGSGWRARPLKNTVQDRFYMIRESNVYGAPSGGYTKINETNLYNATDNVIGEGDAAASASALSALWNTYNGWYINLPNLGEKVLAESLTVNHQIIFTTFQPVTSGSSCSAGTGLGRLYIVSAYDATPVMNMDGVGLDSDLTASDRSGQLSRVGIPPKPTVLFPGDPPNKTPPNPVLCVGAECGKNLNFGNIMERTFWREVTNN